MLQLHVDLLSSRHSGLIVHIQGNCISIWQSREPNRDWSLKNPSTCEATETQHVSVLYFHFLASPTSDERSGEHRTLAEIRTRKHVDEERRSKNEAEQSYLTIKSGTLLPSTRTKENRSSIILINGYRRISHQPSTIDAATSCAQIQRNQRSQNSMGITTIIKRVTQVVVHARDDAALSEHLHHRYRVCGYR